MKIDEFNLTKEGYFGGGLGSEKKPYGSMVFKGGEITIRQVEGTIQISVDDNTESNSGFSIHETMSSFNNVFSEDILTRSESRYRIKTSPDIDFLDKDKLFAIQKVIDQKIIVFEPVNE